jgi:hypothetical protein
MQTLHIGKSMGSVIIVEGAEAQLAKLPQELRLVVWQEKLFRP